MTEDRKSSRIREAVGNRAALDGMRLSFETILARQEENACRIPDLDARKERLRAVKESSVGNAELFEKALAVLKENGFRVIIAKSSEAALRAIEGELEGVELVVKSKSNVTKEIHLAEHLAGKGMEVIETDLGDRIIQLAGCEAAHPTGPACHLTRAQISGLFTTHFKKKVSEEPMELTEVMRDEIASYLSKARAGITGANAVTACEGAVVIVHNEGNAAKCAMLPDKHVIVTTPDKVVPSLEDAINITKLQTYFSTGKIASSYINIITGPSYTADIEKKIYKGMHGPKDLLVVFIDDGRIDAEDKEAQYCIGCGMCLLHCPVYSVIGPAFGTSGHMGGQGVYLSGSIGAIDGAVDAGLYLCTSCGACNEVCPSSVDTRDGIISVRGMARGAKKGNLPEHDVLLASLRNYDNPWQVPRKQREVWAKDLDLKNRGELLYFAGCSTSLLSPDVAKKVVGLISACGREPAYLGSKERCCGSTARKLGDETLARKKAEECFKDFEACGAKLVVTSCPGCSSALNHYEDLVRLHGVKIQHVSEFLDERLDRSLLSRIADRGKVTYHDPCDLGRESGVYDPPRRLIESAIEGKLLEMSKSRDLSVCCGSGSGVKSAYPELASEVARDRVQMARSCGASTVVTSCPWCRQSLMDCQAGDAAIDILDLVELIHESMEKKSRKG